MKQKNIVLLSLCPFIANSYILAKERPNILWLTFEDTSPQFIGCYGNTAAKTPVIDSLANSQNGLRFNCAYSNSTVSSASRSCIITGVDVNKLGTGNHRYERQVPSHIKGFPYYLRQAGYYTSNNYKTDYNISNTDFISTAWNESSSKAHWRNRPADSIPFFSVFNINYSHQSYTTRNTYKYYLDEVYANLQDNRKSTPADIAVPPFYFHNDEMEMLMCRVQNCVNYTDQIIANHLSQLLTDSLTDNTIIFVFADHGEGIPRGKTCALGLGYRVPFVVWFPDKWKHLNPYNSNVISDTQICFEDLAPTVLKLAGVDIPEYMHGIPFLGEGCTPRDYIYASRNRVGESLGIERSVIKGKYVYTRVFSPYLPTVKNQGYDYNCDILKQVRTNRHAGNLNATQLEPFLPRQSEYLYDLEQDEWEINNLANDAAYSDLVSEMRNKMIEYAISIKDAGFMPEYEMGNRAKNNNETPMDVRENNYAIEDVISAALLAGTASLTKQINLLNATDPLVRYWAAVGIYNQGAAAASYQSTIKNYLEKETFDAARLELAAFLYNFCEQTSAAEIVKNYARGGNDELLATEAIIKIQDFGDKIVDFKNFIDTVKTYWNANDQYYTASPAANVIKILINEKMENPFSETPTDKMECTIKNAVTKGYLAVPDGTLALSIPKQALTADENAVWKLVKNENGTFGILKNNVLALGITATTNGALPQLQTYNSNNIQQQWILSSYQYGYQITNANSEKELQVNGQSTKEGATISQWEWNGNSHFTWILKEQSTSTEQTSIPDIRLHNVYPNPAASYDQVNIAFTLHETCSPSIGLYAIDGKKVADYQYNTWIPGQYIVTIPLEHIGKGTFFLILQTENGLTKPKKIIIR